MESSHRGITDRRPSTSVVLLTLLALLTLLPLVNVGITTHDDMTAASLHRSPDLFWSTVHRFAESQSRFYFYVSAPVGAAPYFLGSTRAVHLLGLTTAVAAALILAGTLRKFGHATAGTLVFALFLLSASNSQEHNLFSAYPFTFAFSLCAIFGATALELFRQRMTVGRGIAIGTLFFVGFCTINEASLAYAFLPFVLGSAFRGQGPLIQRARSAARHLLVPLLAVGVYLGCYGAYRAVAPPSEYEGNVLQFQGIGSFLRVVYQYTVSALPGYLPLNIGRQLVWSQVSFAHLTLSPGAVCAAVAAGLLPFALLARLPKRTLPWSELGIFVLAMVAFATIQQILLGLTSKYVFWVEQANSKVYVSTFFSLFFLAIGLAAVITRLYAVCGRAPAWTRWVFKGVLSVIFAVLAGANVLWNRAISEGQMENQVRWDLVDTLLESAPGAALPENAVVIAPSLWATQGIAMVPDWYWSLYFSDQLGRTITVCRDHSAALRASAAGAVGPRYVLHATVDSLDASAIALAPLPHAGPDFSRAPVSSAWVYVVEPDVDTGLLFREKLEPSAGTTGASPGLVHFKLKSKAWTEVRSDSPFFLDTMELTAAEAPLLAADLSVSFGAGFWGLEYSDRDIWQWSLGQSELVIVNQRGSNATVRFECSLVTYGVPRTVTFSLGDQVLQRVEVQPGQASPVSFSLTLPDERNRLVLTSSEPPPTPTAAEPRGLTFAVFNPAVQ